MCAASTSELAFHPQETESYRTQLRSLNPRRL